MNITGIIVGLVLASIYLAAREILFNRGCRIEHDHSEGGFVSSCPACQLQVEESMVRDQFMNRMGITAVGRKDYSSL